VITWEASDNANLDHDEVRYSPGSSYDSDAETVQAESERSGERCAERVMAGWRFRFRFRDLIAW
jgi:hypothetical protein